jgi:chemotaxis protein methyltransferase CheR
MQPPDVEAEAIEVRLFLEAIHARYGYDLRNYAEASIRRRVRAALTSSGLAHLGELQHAVLHDKELFSRVIEDLTVRVSEMFRDSSFYLAFRNDLVPLLRTYPTLKIWHCGCATGEEVYSTAIILEEEGLYDRAQIYATDLSLKALDQSRMGIYPEERFAAFNEAYRRSGGTRDLGEYTTTGYARVAFREQLRKNVLFFQHDLVSDHAFGEMNVVFCRNVLIYFGTALRERVIEKLTESVRPGGFLCLGSAERLREGNTMTDFTEFAPKERIYQRRG